MAKKLTSEQAKKLAYSMFINEDKTYVEISDVVGYSTVSVGNWARDGFWKDFKDALVSSRDNQLKNFVNQLNALNDAINTREKAKGNRYPTASEADTQIKLTKAIMLFRGEADLTEMLTYNRKLLNFLRANHPEQVKEFALLLDEFVKDNL